MSDKSDPIYIRKLKPIGNIIKPGELYLHPVTLELRKNDLKDNFIAIQPYYNPKNNTFEYEYKEKLLLNQNKVDLQKFMSLPYLNLDINYMLHLYNINEIDELLLWLDKQINNNAEYNFINRLLNIWIKYNYDNLQKNNDILVSIYNKIGTKYWTKHIKKYDQKELESKIKKFISEWINNIQVDDFFFDLGNDLKKYFK